MDRPHDSGGVAGVSISFSTVGVSEPALSSLLKEPMRLKISDTLLKCSLCPWGASRVGVVAHDSLVPLELLFLGGKSRLTRDRLLFLPRSLVGVLGSSSWDFDEVDGVTGAGLKGGSSSSQSIRISQGGTTCELDSSSSSPAGVNTLGKLSIGILGLPPAGEVTVMVGKEEGPLELPLLLRETSAAISS